MQHLGDSTFHDPDREGLAPTTARTLTTPGIPPRSAVIPTNQSPFLRGNLALECSIPIEPGGSFVASQPSDGRGSEGDNVARIESSRNAIEGFGFIHNDREALKTRRLRCAKKTYEQRASVMETTCAEPCRACCKS